MSLYGEWVTRAGLPAFEYRADQDALDEAEWDPIQAPPTRRHWVMVGNRGIQMQVANDATVALFDERHVARWLTAPDPQGTGVSIIEVGGARWGSAWDDRPPGTSPPRTIGPTWFHTELSDGTVGLDRFVICPDGEAPWVLVRVRLTNLTQQPVPVCHVEQWRVRPRFLNLFGTPDSRRADAAERVTFSVQAGRRRVFAVEARRGEERIPTFPQVSGPVVHFILEALGDTDAGPRHDEAEHPTLELVSEVHLDAGGSCELWFRAGAHDTTTVEDPTVVFEEALSSLDTRLPRADAGPDEAARAELTWHAAMLTGGLSRDELIGGHTLNQSSAYLFTVGFNGAARDPLQHALPLVYSEPDAALSVLRNTSAWATPDGDLPYALDGAKHPAALGFEPSDQNLWALALAAEYASATGDTDAFTRLLAYHPERRARPVPLQEHLRRQFRYFVDQIGRGEHGHVHMRNADWNDMAVILSGVPRESMSEAGESVLNSAMAAWVLPRYAGLCDRLADPATATEARALGEELRLAVAREWNGRWFNRAYAPHKEPLGESDCWLEVQPWAILCGAADPEQASLLLETIDGGVRAGSPLGARVRWPVPDEGDLLGAPGEGTAGGIWFAVNMTLVWAIRDIDPELAWDEWRRMTLAAHTEAYPAIWSGTLTGPDAYNSIESPRPGQSWGSPLLAMQSNPLNNLHSHAQPLLAYLRLLGLEPAPDGALRVRGGGAWSSRNVEVRSDGHGRLEASGEVALDTPFGRVEGGPGTVEW